VPLTSDSGGLSTEELEFEPCQCLGPTRTPLGPALHWQPGFRVTGRPPPGPGPRPRQSESRVTIMVTTVTVTGSQGPSHRRSDTVTRSGSPSLSP
jgi:hypothetical protein